MINWHLKTIPLKDLKDHAKNPRQITKEHMHHLEALIDKFGMIDKPIVNLDHTIIGGHQRIKILKKQKTKEIECWVPDRQLNQQDVDHLCIGLNLNRGEWDYDILANEWEPLDLLKWGFTEQQLLGLEKEKTATEENAENDQGDDDCKCPTCGKKMKVK